MVPLITGKASLQNLAIFPPPKLLFSFSFFLVLFYSALPSAFDQAPSGFCFFVHGKLLFSAFLSYGPFFGKTIPSQNSTASFMS